MCLTPFRQSPWTTDWTWHAAFSAIQIRGWRNTFAFTKRRNRQLATLKPPQPISPQGPQVSTLSSNRSSGLLILIKMLETRHIKPLGNYGSAGRLRVTVYYPT